MTGLQKLCRLHGWLRCGNIMWVWDYANDCAVHESEMLEGGERWRDSEAAKRRLMEQAKPLTDQQKEVE